VPRSGLPPGAKPHQRNCDNCLNLFYSQLSRHKERSQKHFFCGRDCYEEFRHKKLEQHDINMTPKPAEMGMIVVLENKELKNV